MPSDNPLVGETWETVDMSTGQAAQAVVIEVNPQMVRLQARLGRTMTMPHRSFHLTWKFVLDAPLEACAYQDCRNPAHFQVNDLGRWVWVCPGHLPAHVVPLLPTDTPGDAGTRCPTCGSTASPDTQEVGAATVRHCSRCNNLWGYLVGEEDPNTEEGRFANGLSFGEHLQDLADHFNSEGLQVRGLVGLLAWEALKAAAPLRVVRVDNPGQDAEARFPQAAVVQFAGIPLRIVPGFGNDLAVIGEHPKGVQRLGSGPSVAVEPEALPEVGSVWVDSDGLRLTVDSVGLSEDSRQGRRLVARGTPEGSNTTVRTFPLSDFIRYFRLAPKEAPEPAPEGDGPVKPGSTWWEKRTYRKVFVAKLVKVQGEDHVQTNQGNLIPFPKFLDAHTDKTPDPPCNVGEEWTDNAGKAVFTIEQNLETSALVRYSPGEPPREIPYYILATRYKKSTRRSALQRIVDDE